jgi:hypothetical protein
MSDEQRQHVQVQVAAAEQPGDNWGDPISEAREQKLREILAAWDAPDADHGERKGPFGGVPLTGADVFWLAKRVRSEYGSVPNLHLETLYVNPLVSGVVH